MANYYSIRCIEYCYADNFPVALTVSNCNTLETCRLSHAHYYLESSEHKVVIDTGYSYAGNNRRMADSWGITGFRTVDEALGQFGVSGADIDTVILTHAHIDHAANTAAFPNAEFYLQKRELFESCRRLSLPKRFDLVRGTLDDEDMLSLLRLHLSGRLKLVDGRVENVLPGIDLYPAFDTHSPGHQYVVIRNAGDRLPWICCGDLIFSYKNLSGIDDSGYYTPMLNGGGDLLRLAEVYEEMMTLTGFEAHRILPTHVSEVADIYGGSVWSPGLRKTEIRLRPGDPSRI